MEALIESCAGLDVHQKVVVACVLSGKLSTQRPRKEIKSFSTTTKGLLELRDWLEENGCSVVSMESTGIYWKPIWHILQDRFELILANPRMIKNVPGKKTDMKDAEWIAKLTRVGLMPKSFVPPEPIQDLRDLTRYRKSLTEDMTREKNRLHKVLQCAGIKLTSYIKDVLGKSGRALLNALIDGEVITEELVHSLVYTTLKNKVPELVESLNGFVRKHHREMLGRHLKSIEFMEMSIKELENDISKKLEDYSEIKEQLIAMPGIEENTAAIIIAEIGVDMDEFPTDKHLASWAGLSPGNNESAGKSKSTRIRKGNSYLKKVLAQAAFAASKSKNTRFSSFFWRIAKNRGTKKACIATAHLMLRIIYSMIKTNTPYQELGEHYIGKKIQRTPQTIT